MQLLRRVGVDSAKSIIILNDAPMDASHEAKELADARVVKTILAVISCTGEEMMPPVVAEIHMKSMQAMARNISHRIAIIDEHSILAKLMVQTSRVSGLAQVYDNLVGFDGNEFYFYRPAQGWSGRTYGQALFHFPGCSLIGLRDASGKIKINPPASTVLSGTDDAILLAEDDSAIRFSVQPVPASAPASPPLAPLTKSAEQQLIVGWCQKTSTIIDEYSNYLVEGSGIDLVVEEPTDTIRSEFSELQARHPAIRMRIIKAEIGNPSTLTKLKPEQYDNVIILSGDGGDSELRDSDTIAKLLQFRLYFRSLGKKDLRTQLITEVADSENIEVIQQAGVKDFLISNQFVSKIYAQVSEEPDTLRLYEDLFSETGSEVYLKPVKLFIPEGSGPLSFADLCAAALKRNETCFGVRIVSHETDASDHYGIHINPAKTERFELSPDDQLITLAENET
jgi:hypothetical protein